MVRKNYIPQPGNIFKRYRKIDRGLMNLIPGARKTFPLSGIVIRAGRNVRKYRRNIVPGRRNVIQGPGNAFIRSGYDPICEGNSSKGVPGIHREFRIRNKDPAGVKLFTEQAITAENNA